MDEKLLVLIVNDMVIFPNNEVRIEYDNIYDKNMIDIVDQIGEEQVLIVNPIDDNQSVTSFPKYGILGRIKLKINVPNGKTRVVLEGQKRVEIYSYIENGNFYKACYKDIEIKETEESKLYYQILMKSLEKYIAKVPYMGNAILGQL
ncbi:MAG: LON peptidase substrate-binding domain-containing protein, partial [Bacilli bacterium]|nr:LON peptidase substrate-binding domain-containing protein [Bacilli bacterium]